MPTQTATRPPTKQDIRDQLQIFRSQSEAPEDVALLGEDDLLFAIEEDLLNRLRVDPKKTGAVTAKEVWSALDAYLELSIELCFRLSETEKQLRRIRQLEHVHDKESSITPSCQDLTQLKRATLSIEQQSNLEPNGESICEFLKRIRKELKRYILLTQIESQQLALSSENLRQGRSFLWNPAAPLIA